MTITLTGKSWTFYVDGEKWKVHYGFVGGYWGISHGRDFHREMKAEGPGTQREAMRILKLVVEHKKETDENQVQKTS